MDVEYLSQALRVELAFTRGENAELRDIIQQLTSYTRIEGRPVYIHPYDVMEMLNAADQTELVSYSEKQPKDPTLLRILGTTYKQTVNIPPRSRKAV